MNMLNILKSNKIFLFTFFIGLVSFLTSIIYEYYYGKIPCQLCSVQRSIHELIICISLFGIFTQRKKKILIALMATFIVSAGLGFFHYSIQKGLIQDPCRVAKISNMSDFESMLSKKGCKDLQFQILGISPSFLNGIISLVSCFLLLKSNELNRLQLIKTDKASNC